VPKRPLFLYFAGTTARYDALAPQNVSMAMAARGFVALSVEYDNTASALTTDHVAQLECLFSPEQPQSLIAAACGLPNVDCDLGIATWGHSLGALIAHLAANYDSRVSAAWLTGYAREDEGYFPAPFISTLPFERTRVVNGEADFSAPTTAPAMNHVTGMSDAECPADGRSKCLRADGSGWIVVRKADLALPRATADHCWFDRPSCLSTTIALDPNWIDASSTKDFALESNADWLAETAQRH
jgi:hypothetical protein